MKKYNGNAYVKSYSCWRHLLVMIWAQVTGRRSLRDIEASLRIHSDKTCRMGIGRTVSRSNIAKASARRDVAIYRELAEEMMRRASRISCRDRILYEISRAFGLAGFFAIDSSTVSLALHEFSWSVPQEDTGGIKIHTMYDLLRNVPAMCLVTGHEERDQTFMEDYPYREGCIYMLDRMYFKTAGLYEITSSGAFFITRMKKNVRYETVASSGVDGTRVLSDETIRLTSRLASGGYPDVMRLVRYYSLENNETLALVSNNFGLDAATIALLYRYRWQIEVFFKWIKQHLRITRFYGTSANAVMMQVYVAFITFCMLAMAADAHKHKSTLYEFANMMSVVLTERIHLQELMERYERGQMLDIVADGPSLFDSDNL
ncbi:MAG: IS4 family transposase [Prevotella sp.]|nr:IS4 family transposase [Prevotella sp.]MDE6151160.1 IS4 family transposase [Prevotella sp.]